MNNFKRCGRCREKLPQDQFHRSARASDGRQTHCKQCDVLRSRDRMSDPQVSFAKTLWRYNLSVTEYMDLLKAQDYNCGGCYVPARSVPYRLYVDHNYVNGYVRGLLCSGCNRIIGMAHDEVGVLARLAGYVLEGGPVADIHLEAVAHPMPARPKSRVPLRPKRLMNLSCSYDGGPLYAPFMEATA